MYVAEINIPSGSEGMFVDGFSVNPYQFEYVLPLGSQLVVTRKHNPADGITKMTYLGISKETKKKCTLSLDDTYFVVNCDEN